MVKRKRKSIYCDEYCDKFESVQDKRGVYFEDVLSRERCQKCRDEKNRKLKRDIVDGCTRAIAKDEKQPLYSMFLRGNKTKTKWFLSVKGEFVEEVSRGEQLTAFPAKRLLKAVLGMNMEERAFYEEEE